MSYLFRAIISSKEEKDMREISVEEHIGDQLPRHKEGVEVQRPVGIIEYGVERALGD